MLCFLTEFNKEEDHAQQALPSRRHFIQAVSYYRWRKEYGGMAPSQVKRLKQLEKENQRLRKAVSDLTLDKLILEEAAKGNF